MDKVNSNYIIYSLSLLLRKLHNQKYTLTNRENNEKDDIEDKFSDGCPHKDLLVLRNQNFSSGPHSSNTVTEAK